MSNKIWQSFGALNKTERHQAQVEDEFREDLPFEAEDKGLLSAQAPRRDFLKYLGFSTAAATVAASRVLGLNEDQMVNALGINYSQVAGNLLVQLAVKDCQQHF